MFLAAHEFHRVNRAFPTSLEQLVLTYLDEIPIDPLDKEWRQLNYRYDDLDNAFVWSVGLDADGSARNPEANPEPGGEFGLWLRFRTPHDSDRKDHAADNPRGATAAERLLLDRDEAQMNSLLHPKE